MKKQISKFGIYVFLVVFITACGGGGGDKKQPPTEEPATEGPVVETPQTYACSDSIDNDYDGLTDYPADSGCTSATDNDEYNVVVPLDTTPPTLTVLGELNVILTEGDTYTESGATSVDEVDGTVEVVITGSVDTSIADVYVLTYTATDNAGNSVHATRTVVVLVVLELSISIDNSSPEAKSIPGTTVGFFNVTSVIINNPFDTEQGVTIASITAEGDPDKMITGVQIVDDSVILGTAVLSEGRGYFESISINIPPNSSKTLSVQVELNSEMQPFELAEWIRKVRFGFTMDDIIPSQALLTGLPAWGEYVYVEKGNLLYPCVMAICSLSMETGDKTVLWNQSSKYPRQIVPSRKGNVVAFSGANILGIYLLSLDDLSANFVISSAVGGYFDLTEYGDVAVIPKSYSEIGSFGQLDIVLIKTDGSNEWIRVTNDTTPELYPVIGSPGGVASDELVVLYAIDNMTGGFNIWKKVVNTNMDTVSDATLVVSGISGDTDIQIRTLLEERIFSVNKDYSKIVFVRSVDGILHLFSTSITGGSEVDLGEGRHPQLATDGSNRMLFTYNNDSWIANIDGSNRRKAPIPDNLYTHRWDPDQIVFSSVYP